MQTSHAAVDLQAAKCRGKFDLKCKGKDTVVQDVCFESDMQCVGATWPFWKQCKGVFMHKQAVGLAGFTEVRCTPAWLAFSLRPALHINLTRCTPTRVPSSLGPALPITWLYRH